MSIGLTRDEYDDEIAHYEARIAELESLVASFNFVDAARREENDQLKAENQRLREVLKGLARSGGREWHAMIEMLLGGGE